MAHPPQPSGRFRAEQGKISAMEAGDLLALVVRWAHILAAITAVGGLLFLRFVLHPSARAALDEEARGSLHDEIRGRWQRVVMACISLLLLSGFYNFATISMAKAKEHPSYHAWFGVKFLAALGVFLLAGALTGRSEALAGIRRDAGRWLAVSALLAVAVILISGVLRTYP
ncbi:MAG: hypothetical protein ACE5GW_00065 [Planctomycetota bacterium]